MIEEKINNSLRELEQGLKDLESARKQVNETVNSYNGLKKTTSEYVSLLSSINTIVQGLIYNVGNDYSQKVKEFEKDRATIINASNIATEKLTNATEEFKNSLNEIRTKLFFSIIVNAISLIAIGIILFLLIKRFIAL